MTRITPEGDGKSDGREEVDRGQRQGVAREIRRLEQRRPPADPGQRRLGRRGDRRVGLGMDRNEPVRGQRRAHFVVGGGGGNRPCGLERGVGAVARRLRRQISRRDAPDAAVAEVRDQRRALVRRRQPRGRAAFGDEGGVGLGLGQGVVARPIFGLEVEACRQRLARRHDQKARRHQRVQHRAQIEAGVGAEAGDRRDPPGAVAEPDGQQPFEPRLLRGDARIGHARQRSAQGGHMVGLGVAGDGGEGGAAAVRVGVRQLELHQRGGDQRPDTGVGAPPVEVAFRRFARRGGGGGIGQAQGIALGGNEERAVCVARPQSPVGPWPSETPARPGRRWRRWRPAPRGPSRGPAWRSPRHWREAPQEDRPARALLPARSARQGQG